jgi:hypothetical protein
MTSIISPSPVAAAMSRQHGYNKNIFNIKSLA